MSIYEPAEDSFLMSETLSKEIPKLLIKNPNLKFFEIGAGSGINLQTALDEGIAKENIFGSDINIKSVGHCKSLGFNVVMSDLFEKIIGKFDLVVFNPPYLPTDEKEPKNSRRETTGGLKGNEMVLRFLKQAKNHLDKNGKIFLITSSLSEKVDFEKLGFQAKEINSKNLFFEKLSLWELRSIG